MQRLAELEHHVVRDVDDGADRPQARTTQPLLHPERRLAHWVRMPRTHAADELRTSCAALRARTGKRVAGICACDRVHGRRMQRLVARAATSRATPATLMQSPRFGVRFTSKIVSSRPQRCDQLLTGLQRSRQIEQSRRVLARARAHAPSTTCRGLDAAQLRLLDLRAVRQLRADRARAAPSCRRARSARRRRSAALRVRSRRRRR